MGKKCSIKNVVELFSIIVGSVIWVWGVKSAFDILVDWRCLFISIC